MFLVLKLPRTGSSMLGKVLDSHPEIHCTNEVLNSVQKSSQQKKLNFLTEFFVKRVSSGDGKVSGATLNPFKYRLKPRDLKKAIAAVHSQCGETGGLKVVLLLRRNKLRQAVSAYLSIERGTWHSDLGQLKDGPDPKKEFDLNKLQRMTFNFWWRSRGLIRLAKQLSRDCLPVMYEELSATPGQTCSRIFEFLGAGAVEDGFDFTAGFQKIAPDDLRQSIANYDRIRRYPFLRRYLDI